MFFSRRRNPTPLLLASSLSYVSQLRFFVILFDPRLTRRFHCMSLSERCAKDLRLLRVVSFRVGGADFTTLRSLSISPLRSKHLYDPFFFHKAARSTLEVLDRIQYAAARVILGLLRFTLVTLLESVLTLCLCLSVYAVHSYSTLVVFYLFLVILSVMLFTSTII